MKLGLSVVLAGHDRLVQRLDVLDVRLTSSRRAGRASRRPRSADRRSRRTRPWCRPRSRCGCRRRADQVAELLVAGEAGRLATRRPLRGRRPSRTRRWCGRTGWCRGRRPGRTGRARGAPPSPCRPRFRRPGRAGRSSTSTPTVWPCSGWPGGQAAPLAQVLEVFEGQAVAGQVQLDVERQAGVAAGQHEPVAADPGGVGRVVAKQSLKQQICRGRKAHRGARVAVARLLRRRPSPVRGSCRLHGGRGRTIRGTPRWMRDATGSRGSSLLLRRRRSWLDDHTTHRCGWRKPQPPGRPKPIWRPPLGRMDVAMTRAGNVTSAGA